jgi:hypothetical protein
MSVLEPAMHTPVIRECDASACFRRLLAHAGKEVVFITRGSGTILAGAKAWQIVGCDRKKER